MVQPQTRGLVVKAATNPGAGAGWGEHIFPQGLQKDFADSLILDFQPLDLGANAFLLF